MIPPSLIKPSRASAPSPSGTYAIGSMASAARSFDLAPTGAIDAIFVSHGGEYIIYAGNAETVYIRQMSTPHNITTCGAVLSSINLTSTFHTIRGIWANQSGTVIYVAGKNATQTDTIIRRYTMTAWTPSTMSFATELSVAAWTSTNLRGLSLSESEEYMAVLSTESGAALAVYTMSTPGTLTTASQDGTFDLRNASTPGNGGASVRGLNVSRDGTVFSCAATDDTAYQWSCGSAWQMIDANSPTLDNTYDFSATAPLPSAYCIAEDGDHAYILDETTNDDCREFTLT